LNTTTQIAETHTPDGTPVELLHHDGEFIITVDRQDLMLSRTHESELELSRLGCAHLTTHPNPTILIGGLGMGYTLRQALDLLLPQASVVLAELLPDIVRWHHDYLGNLTQHALNDSRVILKLGDVGEEIRQSPGRFDAILLDVDNGPLAMTDLRNDSLYSRAGIRSCLDALKPEGCLAVWSAIEDRAFEERLRQETPHVRCVGVPSYKGATANHCRILVATARAGRRVGHIGANA
jgi:spermidine synthase